MKARKSFERKKVSELDKNPWSGQLVDEIKDYGFFNGSGPRIGIIKSKIEDKETRSRIEMIRNQCEQVINLNSKKKVRIINNIFKDN